MRVLLVASSFPPVVGGLQSVIAHLAGELHHRGHQVSVITQRHPRTLPSVEELNGVHVRRLVFLVPRLSYLQNKRADLFLASLFLFPWALILIIWRIWRERPQVVNLHFAGAPTLFVLIARWLIRFRFVVSLHGDDVEGLARGSWFDRWVFRAAIRKAEAVTACSRYLLNQAQAIETCIAEKGRVVYNGTDLSGQASDTPPGKTVLAAGRMVPNKGFDLLLEAIARCRDAGLDVSLVLAGDGPERGKLESLARSLRLNGRVSLLGALGQQQIRVVMASSGVVAIPSRSETFGMVALEAMAAGKPVVAARVGGLPEVLEGADAILVPPDDPKKLAEAIANTLARVEHEPTFGRRNREIATRFSVARMVDQYEAIYDN